MKVGELIGYRFNPQTGEIEGGLEITRLGTGPVSPYLKLPYGSVVMNRSFGSEFYVGHNREADTDLSLFVIDPATGRTAEFYDKEKLGA